MTASSQPCLCRDGDKPRPQDRRPDDAVLEFLSLLLARATGEVEVRIEDRRADRVTTVRCQVKDTDALAAAADQALPAVRFSDDYRTAYWFGETIPLTETQARAVQHLWEAYKKGTPDVAHDTLLTACGSDGVKISDVFKGSLAWGRLIIWPQRGVYRINTDGRRPASATAVEAPA
jgi:hypothetical protein